jgi:thiol:disulfide interchange protein DsbD
MRTILATILILTTTLGAKPVRDGAFVGEFVAAKTAVQPGETIDIALRIQHDDAFHTYWKAPGIVGVPTEIKWTMKGGLEPGDILWPQPQRIKMGPYWAYGYEGETFLVVPLTAPEDAKPGTIAKLTAKVSFMVCPAVLTETNTCYPGFVDLDFEIPIAKEPGATTAWAKHIAAARKTFAVPNEAWDASATRSGEQLTLTLRARAGIKFARPESFYFYSYDGTVHSDKEQTVTHHDDGRITISLTRSEFAPKGKSALEGILFTDTGLADGSGAAPVLIEAPYRTKP